MKNQDIVDGIVIKVMLRGIAGKSYAGFTAKVLDNRYFIPRELDNPKLLPFHSFTLEIFHIEYHYESMIKLEVGKVITLDDLFFYDMFMIESVHNYEELKKQKRQLFEKASNKCFDIKNLLNILIQKQ